MFDTTDGRAAQRRRTLKGARIIFNAGRSTIDCIVRNLSGKGARLELPSVVGVPNTFDLSITDDGVRPCRVAWRSLKELGVEFVQDKP